MILRRRNREINEAERVVRLKQHGRERRSFRRRDDDDDVPQKD